MYRGSPMAYEIITPLRLCVRSEIDLASRAIEVNSRPDASAGRSDGKHGLTLAACLFGPPSAVPNAHTTHSLSTPSSRVPRERNDALPRVGRMIFLASDLAAPRQAWPRPLAPDTDCSLQVQSRLEEPTLPARIALLGPLTREALANRARMTLFNNQRLRSTSTCSFF